MNSNVQHLLWYMPSRRLFQSHKIYSDTQLLWKHRLGLQPINSHMTNHYLSCKKDLHKMITVMTILLNVTCRNSWNSKKLGSYISQSKIRARAQKKLCWTNKKTGNYIKRAMLKTKGKRKMTTPTQCLGISYLSMILRNSRRDVMVGNYTKRQSSITNQLEST